MGHTRAGVSSRQTESHYLAVRRRRRLFRDDDHPTKVGPRTWRSSRGRDIDDAVYLRSGFFGHVGDTTRATRIVRGRLGIRLARGRLTSARGVFGTGRLYRAP
jgi:hypothetical protein